MPPRPPRVEESSDEVRRVFVPLDHMLTGLCIDQARTRLTKDGQLEQIVATYSTTTRDIGDGFRQRVQTVLDALPESVANIAGRRAVGRDDLLQLPVLRQPGSGLVDTQPGQHVVQR